MRRDYLEGDFHGVFVFMAEEAANTGSGTGNNGEGGAGGQGGQPAAGAGTSDGAGNNTAAGTNTGAGTHTAQQPEGQQPKEKTFTQGDVNRMIADRLPKAVKAELKKLTGEGDGTLTVEELQRQLSDEKQKTRVYSARETVTEYLGDPANKLNIKAENVRAIEKLILPDLEYDDNGKPTNLKEAVESARKLAPALFTNSPASINAGAGNNGNATGFDMNAQIRRAAGRQT